MIEVILASKSERKKESENFKSITRDYSRSISNRESNSGYDPKISFSYGWDYEKKAFQKIAHRLSVLKHSEPVEIVMQYLAK